jgi:hypothetical protein
MKMSIGKEFAMADVQSILNEIRHIGPVLPGSLDSFFNVCGKAGCRCKDQQNPQKHGPYYRLSYSLAGKNSSIFVKQHDVEAIKVMVDNYKKLRALTTELALATLDSVKKRGVAESIQQFENICTTDSTWKDKCRIRAQQLKAAAVKIRDLSTSRDKWREECLQLRGQIKDAKTKLLKNQSTTTEQTGGKK